MTRLRRRVRARERMDDPDVDRVTLEAALDHVAMVNRWTGARRALLRHLPDALPPGRSRVLDVGTGSADLPIAMAKWAERRQRTLCVLAADRHEATLDVARRRTASRPQIRLVRADALQLPFPTGSFDLALLSMTLHHLEGPELVGSLAELGRVARGGRILVGELERSLPNYVGARLLAGTLWRSNPITRHDGPLSVLRSFTPGELLELAALAGLREPVVHRHPLFRLVLLARG
jgi:ubiquinone/menaquinone biosynthesis C-methylase UbiE